MALEIVAIHTVSPQETESTYTRIHVVDTTVGEVKIPTEPREFDITHVKLADGTIKTRQELTVEIDAGAKYFFKSSEGIEVPVMTIRPQSYQIAFIKTQPGSGSKEKLLNLPKFDL